MRIYMFAKGRELPRELRTHVESRVRRAVAGVSHRLPWVAVRLGHREEHAVDSSVVCQLDTWLRGIGIVTVSHTDVDAYVAIDRAATRLAQAVRSWIREMGTNHTFSRRGNAPWNRVRAMREFV